MQPIITSLLDTDLYKITMQAAIHKHYPDTACEFLLTNRTPNKRLNKRAYEWFHAQLMLLKDLTFTDEEIDYLKTKIGYMGESHFEWMKTVKLHPEDEIHIDAREDLETGEYDLSITASGNWDVVTLYEIPVLALLSECYFRFMDTKWTINSECVATFDETTGELSKEAPQESMQIVYDQAYEKAKKLLTAGCVFSEFGTRRRRSFHVQDSVMAGIMSFVNSPSTSPEISAKFLGTSNVLLAKKYGVNPIGTIGHEWMMGVGAANSIKGDGRGYQSYITANRLAMEQYVDTVGPQHAGLALTDTYGTDNYLQQFEEPYIGYYIGVRQDSGSPEEYAMKLSKWYREKGYSGRDKLICFSDSLNVDKCIRLKKVCDSTECNINCTFGIGTNLTNDFDSEPMNIVMKLVSCGGGKAIKISDNVHKNMGDPTTVKEVKKLLGYVEHDWAGGDETHRWAKHTAKNEIKSAV